jgi:hypothetical protein
VTTAFGCIALSRPYVVASGEGSFPADEHLGVDGFLTTAAKRLVTLAGVAKSFAQAERLLAELCGWSVDAETIRRTTHESAKAIAASRPSRADAGSFAAAAGEIEVAIDAGKVNTRIGWKDVKIAVFLRRIAGTPATPPQWDARTLPRPTNRVLVAAIEDAEAFTRRVRTESDRLNVTLANALTVLGDGAEWIWNLSETVFPLADELLDAFHAVEHISDAVKAVWGDGTEAAASHRDVARHALLTGGKIGVERWLQTALPQVPPGVSHEPLIGLLAYLAKHPTRLDYAERLAEGRSIGSGAVESAVKQTVNLRLKRTGARWRPEHVGPLVELIALSDTPEWAAAWVAA